MKLPPLGDLKALESMYVPFFASRKKSLLPPLYCSLTPFCSLICRFIEHNELIVLPPSIGQLPKLRNLYVRFNSRHFGLTLR